MLKIKDEVDLKELEKFGFRNTKDNTYFINEPNDDFDSFETGILINPAGQFEKNEIMFEINDIDNSEVKCDIDVLSRIDTLYDLITAGLVEKREEE